ncbi:MAG: hypothetical protein QOG43_2175 [Actinomycetota bacterium]|jgi:hypothetical protein|nr:hypothetical protein [Actinomycetota bacterium]
MPPAGVEYLDGVARILAVTSGRHQPESASTATFPDRG